MPEEYDDFDDDDDDEETEPQPQPSQEERFREMRKRARRTSKAERERDEAQRELAMVRAGIDTSSRLGQMFAKAYDGPLDKTALTAAAQEIPGLVAEATPPPAPEAPEPSSAGDGSTDERDQLHGGQPPEQIVPDPMREAVKRGQDAIAAGRDEEDGMVEVFRTIYEAGSQGDERAIWSEEKHHRQVSG